MANTWGATRGLTPLGTPFGPFWIHFGPLLDHLVGGSEVQYVLELHIHGLGDHLLDIACLQRGPKGGPKGVNMGLMTWGRTVTLGVKWRVKYTIQIHLGAQIHTPYLEDLRG